MAGGRGPSEIKRSNLGTTTTAALHMIGWRPWLIAAMLGLAFGFFLQFAPVRAAEIGGPDSAGFVLGSYGLAIIATRAAAGGWLDRARLARVALIGGSFLIVGLGALAAGPLPLAIVGAVALGLGGGIVQPAMLAECVRRAPGRAAWAVAVGYFGFDLGLAVSGLILGPVASIAGTRGAFAAASLLMVGMVLLGCRGEPTGDPNRSSSAIAHEDARA